MSGFYVWPLFFFLEKHTDLNERVGQNILLFFVPKCDKNVPTYFRSHCYIFIHLLALKCEKCTKTEIQ